MRTFLVLLCALSGLRVFASSTDPKYPVSEIPDAIRKEVNVVFRDNTETFTILAKNKATRYVHKVITILNEQGRSLASEVVGYDKLTKIKDLNGSVYDGTGKLIKRLKNSEVYDQSAFDGMTLFSDNRLKAVQLAQGAYPYTVEFEYEIEYKFLFQIPGFAILPEEKMSVQHAVYTLTYPVALKPKYKMLNIDQKPVVSKSEGGIESMMWTFENIPPIKQEPFGPPAENLSPQILSAPSIFQYDEYEGSMNTWDEFGKWIVALNKNRDQIPASTHEKLISLTAGLKTTEEKAKAVYEYLQSKTRYVSIQLGIGGYQPFEASVVDETGYGDCKALSNYMVAMLKSLGIKAHYVLINAGADAREMKIDFVSSQFNHAVVAVPNGPDTLWLECTSQSNPFGYAGTFTGQRRALLITDNGAVIAHTPRYTAEENLQSCSGEVTLDVTGNAEAKVRTVYQGLQYENSDLNGVLDNQYDAQKKWLLANTKIPSFDITSFKISNRKEKIPAAFIDLNLTLNRFATISGKRIFMTPNLMNRSTYIPEKVENRKTKVVRKIAYIDLDTIRYHLPAELYPEFLPENVKINNRFGEYESSFKIEQGNLVYTRRIKMNKGEFPAESYGELIDFYKSISRADNTKLVFMTKT